MQRLTLGELTTITDIGVEELKSKRRRDQLAFAFGCSDASARLRYVPSDCVAVMVTKDLAKTHGAKQAAQIVRAFADGMLRAVALSEADIALDVMFVVTDFVDADGKRAFLASAAQGATADAVAADAVEVTGYVAERINAVNISRIVRVVRANAARLRIDLREAFMPAPNSAEFDDLMKSFEELPSGIVEARALRRHEVAARKAGELARAVAMGGTGRRNPRERASEVTATAAIPAA